MAKRLLNTLLTIMLAALFSGCGRSSSNDRPSLGEQVEENNAVAEIIGNDVCFDPLTLDEYAHSVSRGEDFDNVQTAYMLMHCKAAATYMESTLSDLLTKNDPTLSIGELSEFAQVQWLDDYKYIIHYLKSVSLTPEFDAILADIEKINAAINADVNSLVKQQGLQHDLLYAI